MPVAARHVVAALAAGLLAGCTSGSSPVVPGEIDAGYSVIVGRDGIAFQPGAGDGGLVVPVDTPVHWRFATSGYNVVSGTIVDGGCVPDNQFCSGVDLDAGAVDCSQAPLQLASSRWSHSFADAGTYTYFSTPQCQGQIQGVITVR
jgi:plastocyanin